MAEPGKMAALKKACADMILNTAKEAASRVMESERKALRFQQDLFAAKDEAFRMILHLKQIIDAKAIEAKISSSSQQAKIDELEAQLQEAEGVIVDLRAELKWALNQLEKVRNPLNGKIKEAEVCSQDEKHGSEILSSDSTLPALTTSDTNSTLHDQNILEITYLNEEQVEHPSVSDFCIHTSLATELHGNDCTRTIPAAENNLLAGTLPPNTESEDQLRMFKNEVKMNPLPRLDPGLTLIKGGVDTISGSTNNITVSVKALNPCDILQNTANNGVELVDKAAVANTTFPGSEPNPYIVDVPVVHSDYEDLNLSKEGIIDVSILYSDPKDAEAYKEPKIAGVLDNNGLLKYTFQRKRKMDASICPEKSTVKRRAEGFRRARDIWKRWRP